METMTARRGRKDGSKLRPVSNVREIPNSELFDFGRVFVNAGATTDVHLYERFALGGAWRFDWVVPATDTEYLEFLDSGEMTERGLCEQEASY